MEHSPEGMKALADRVVAAVAACPVTFADEDRERLQSVGAAAERLGALSQTIPFAWITAQWLAGVEAVFDPVCATLESYVSSEDQTQPPAIQWQDATNLWAAIAPMLPAVPGRFGEDVAKEAVAFRDESRRLLAGVQAQAQEVSARIPEVVLRIEELDSMRVDAVAEIQAHQAELESVITEQKARLEAAIRQNQEQFSNSQEENRREFSALLTHAKTDLGATFDEAEVTTGERIESIREQTSAVVERLQRLEAEATKSYQAVTTASVAGFFQSEADLQRKAANRWRISGVVVLALLCAVAIGELLLGDSTPSLDHSAARLPFAIAAAALAGYALRESGRHRMEERHLRQREVDVSTIAPYLANIGNAEEVEALQLAHARKLFLTERDTDQLVDPA